MKKSIVSGYMAALLFMGVAGCERKNGDAIVIGKDYVLAVKQGEENQRRAGDQSRTMDHKIRMRDNDRVKVTYRAGKYTGTVWDAEIQ